jgi:hypothetical protein
MVKATETEPQPTSLSNLPECITQDPREPAGADFLAVCTRWLATEIACSIYCPPECGGHPICRECLALGLAKGIVVAR